MVFGARWAHRCGMRRSTDVSRAESRHLAVASATLGPWRTAAVVGAVGGGLSLVLNTFGGDFGLGVLADALSLAMMLFFVVGGAGSVLGRRGEGSDRRIRAWARNHPWQVAAVPAGLLFAGDLVMRQILTSQGFFGSFWDALWRSVVVGAVIGVVGAVAGSRRS
jgi:hypothetical protein